jgi:alanine racemase
MAELAEWDAFVTKNWRGGVALHVDTGMNRLGITVDEAVAIAPRLQSEKHGFLLLMSHLACAETPDHPLNDKQIRLFREIRILYRGISSSLANSSGIFLGGTLYCDLVRPGIALFGSNPTPGKPIRSPVVGSKVRSSGAHHQQGRNRRLWRDLQPAARATLQWSQWLPTASCDQPRQRVSKPAR